MDYEVKTEGEMAANPEIQSKNGLLYVLPQSLSSSVNKTFIRQQSQRQSYKPGETIVFDMNTGNRYIDPENTMLMLTVETDETKANAFDPTGVYTPLKKDIGGLALINQVQIHAKSGVELDRIQECNQYAFTRAKLRENSDYWNKWASMWGGGNYTTAAGTPRLAKCGAVGTRIGIPMKLISGLFDPVVSGMKMPPALCSGSRIEITLEKFGRAFNPAVGSHDATTYTVSNPVITTLAHELSDNSEMVLNEESVENGLEYTYNRVFTDKQPLTSGTVNIQVKKAVSQGLRAFSVPLVTTDLTLQSTVAAYTSPVGFNSYQYRIGSQYYPQQKVDSPVEGFWTTMNLYNKSPQSSWFSSSLSFDEYLTTTVMGAGFETDQRLNLTGVPINNSATLALEAEVNPGAYTWMTFFEYVAVARCFLTNVEVKI